MANQKKTNTTAPEKTPDIETTEVEKTEAPISAADSIPKGKYVTAIRDLDGNLVAEYPSEVALTEVEKLLRENDPASEEFQNLYYQYLNLKKDLTELQNPTILTRIKQSKPAQFLARHKKASIATGTGLAALGIFALAASRSEEDEEDIDTTEETSEEVEVTEF